MIERIYNNNIKVIIKLISSYLKSMNEWYWNYMIAIYLTIILLLILINSMVLGSSVIVNKYLEIWAIILAIHVYMSYKAIIHDYIYNRYIVRICTNMVLIIIIGVFIEVIKN